MKRSSFKGMECGIAQALEMIGDPWSVLVIRGALFGITAFEDFQKDLGIARNTLTDRLNNLVENGILTRTVCSDDRRKVQYNLTESGRDLWVVLLALSQWGNKWAFSKIGPPSYVADQKSQQAVPPLKVTDKHGQPLSLKDMTLILGPSGSEELERKIKYLVSR
jgi:DNA-binding HxlR family transcriptional regulator